jgi:hypothetical protein
MSCQKPPPDGLASAELRAIRAADQKARASWTTLTRTEQAALVVADRQRRTQVREILDADRAVTSEDFGIAGLIFQHGESPDDYLLAHELAVLSGIRGALGSLPALTEDRFLESLGRRQRFGSQFKARQGGQWALSPIDDDSETRVTDALRAVYLVPPLALTRSKGLEATTLDLATPWVKAAIARVERLRKRRSSQAPTGWNRAEALRRYRDDRLESPAEYRAAAQAFLEPRPSNDALLAHELAVVAAILGDRAARPLVSTSLAVFLQTVAFRRTPAPAAILRAFEEGTNAEKDGRTPWQ